NAAVHGGAMTAVLIVLVVALALALAALTAIHFRNPARRSLKVPATRARRILFPFMANALSSRALDAAFRLAIAEDATLVPVFLAHVPLNVPLETPLPRQCAVALPLQEAIEQRATRAGIPVDNRIELGRDYRHALRRAIANERYDRIVIAAASHGTPGFSPGDVAWLLDHAPGEIVILRADTDEPLTAPPRIGRSGDHRAINREYETAASR
ncbi:MAG TPA: universal stress protein, partial [Solirubrobacteraceae bacterium]